MGGRGRQRDHWNRSRTRPKFCSPANGCSAHRRKLSGARTVCRCCEFARMAIEPALGERSKVIGITSAVLRWWPTLESHHNTCCHNKASTSACGYLHALVPKPHRCQTSLRQSSYALQRHALEQQARKCVVRGHDHRHNPQGLRPRIAAIPVRVSGGRAETPGRPGMPTPGRSGKPACARRAFRWRSSASVSFGTVTTGSANCLFTSAATSSGKRIRTDSIIGSITLVRSKLRGFMFSSLRL